MGDNYGATIADCVDSKSIETSNREMLDLYDDEDDDENDREFIVNELDGTVDPYVGMEFESEEAAMVYYDAYAKRVGFIIRVGNCHRSGRDGSVISRRFLCNKEGFRVSNKKMKRLEVRKPREITREGCRAMIMVRKDKSGKWIVTKLETEHCHPLGIPTGKGRRGSVQARPQDEKDQRIQELTLELYNERQKCKRLCAAYQEQLRLVLKDIEEHTDHLSRGVEDAVQKVRDLENEHPH
ncbi:protein FAR1-RELATED SEQUENCE 5-like isoform X3 [Vitis vinifera]|uniref:protein FAR1-RELATED SEQUENCE 5-like isoform X3 n=1 Tax=Vitis vinifera TaxID=29760 RepID=UPI00288339AB|nr:protein FAR1-RELATED SEQUENCE 5-like isoform X3 [Vitis vinifera]